MGVNYPELGGIETKTRFYNEGEEFMHPSGYVYKVVKSADGKLDWRPIRTPDGREILNG